MSRKDFGLIGSMFLFSRVVLHPSRSISEMEILTILFHDFDGEMCPIYSLMFFAVAHIYRFSFLTIFGGKVQSKFFSRPLIGRK